MGSIKNLDKVLKALNRLPQNLDREMEIILQDNATSMERSAKRFAPVGQLFGGTLRQSITSFRAGKLDWRFKVSAPYWAYVEFGTGGLVLVPPELYDIAIKFKGKGLKKIDLRPRPFVYPALVLQRKQYFEDLENLLNRELKKI